MKTPAGAPGFICRSDDDGSAIGHYPGAAPVQWSVDCDTGAIWSGPLSGGDGVINSVMLPTSDNNNAPARITVIASLVIWANRRSFFNIKNLL
jgi:hypothetical protein